MSQDILIKLNHKKHTHRRWKQGQVSWEEYRDTVQRCRAGFRKPEDHLELNLARDANGNKKIATGTSSTKG